MCIVIGVNECRRILLVVRKILSDIVLYFSLRETLTSSNPVVRTTSNLPCGCEMRTSVGSKHVPAFLTKLWKLVEDPACDDLISWSESGNSFVIHNDVQFAKELLPMYFKHNHMASFVRQLNMYGFRKLNHIEYGGMHFSSNEIEFYHQYFLKGQESLLKMIKRKVSNSKFSEVSESKPGCMKEVAMSIKDIKDQQQSTEKMVKDLKQQNEILWKQLAMVNDRCVKQQRLLTELVPVFFDIVQPSPSLPYKRKAPLMIDDGLAMKKVARLSLQYLNRQKQSSIEADNVPSSPFSISNSGPVIRDVTEMETKKPYADDISRSPEIPKENEVFVDSPLSCKLGNSEQLLDSRFTEREVMEPFDVLNFRNGVGAQNGVTHKQPLTMATSTPSPHVPFHSDIPAVKSPTANNFSPHNSLSTVSSPSLDSSCSPTAAPGDVGSHHSEFCGSDENITAMKAVLRSVPDQNSILSNTLMRDTCLSTATEVPLRERPFTVMAHTCTSPLLLSSRVQSGVHQTPVTTDLINSFNRSPSVNSSAFTVCSPTMSGHDNSHLSENHSNEEKIKINPSANDSDVGPGVLTSGHFDENARGADANLNWLGGSESTEELGIENWIGQLFRNEGYVTNCDLDMSYNI